MPNRMHVLCLASRYTRTASQSVYEQVKPEISREKSTGCTSSDKARSYALNGYFADKTVCTLCKLNFPFRSPYFVPSTMFSFLLWSFNGACSLITTCVDDLLVSVSARVGYIFYWPTTCPKYWYYFSLRIEIVASNGNKPFGDWSRVIKAKIATS